MFQPRLPNLDFAGPYLAGVGGVGVVKVFCFGLAGSHWRQAMVILKKSSQIMVILETSHGDSKEILTNHGDPGDKPW